jgi:hypothetical protein
MKINTALCCLHYLQFTVAPALGFSVSTSRLLTTDVNIETITSNHYEVFLFSTNFPWLSSEISELYCKLYHFSTETPELGYKAFDPSQLS